MIEIQKAREEHWNAEKEILLGVSLEFEIEHVAPDRYMCRLWQHTPCHYEASGEAREEQLTSRMLSKRTKTVERAFEVIQSWDAGIKCGSALLPPIALNVNEAYNGRLAVC